MIFVHLFFRFHDVHGMIMLIVGIFKKKHFYSRTLFIRVLKNDLKNRRMSFLKRVSISEGSLYHSVRFFSRVNYSQG